MNFIRRLFCRPLPDTRRGRWALALGLFLAVVTFTAAGLWFQSWQAQREFEETVGPAVPHFLALGDSYTIGEGVKPEERWPVQLAVLLRTRGVKLAEPTIIAKTGWTTGDLSAALDKAKPQGPYALVSLLIGVNNQYRGRDVEEYRSEFAALLRRAIDYAGGKADRVLVLSIPDWSVTPFAQKRDPAAIAAAINRYNAVNREETAKTGAQYVEITEGSRRAKDEPSLLAPDGLHPSGKMYATWAEAAFPPAQAALGTARP